MKRPTRATAAGQAYLDLQNRARAEGRATQELLTLYVVERWLARLSVSPYADQFIIKGGVLLAAYDARRPTADLDALARAVSNDQSAVVERVIQIARQAPADDDDGVEYRADTASSRIIRDEALYSGVRIAMDCAITTAVVKFRLDVNFGDPVTPAPGLLTLPSLRPGMPPVRVLGYPSRPCWPKNHHGHRPRSGRHASPRLRRHLHPDEKLARRP
jgi:Nucleotidyl transferase AbiEii toxin, Type IV TA system